MTFIGIYGVLGFIIVIYNFILQISTSTTKSCTEYNNFVCMVRWYGIGRLFVTPETNRDIYRVIAYQIIGTMKLNDPKTRHLTVLIGESTRASVNLYFLSVTPVIICRISC